MMRLFLAALFALAWVGAARAQSATQNNAEVVSNCGSPNSTYKAGSGNYKPETQDTSGNTCVTTTPSATTWQARITLSAATDTSLISANVTMDYGSLPAAGAFHLLTIIPPSSCTVGLTLSGQTASATVGEQMGSGTNVGSDSINMTGISGVPHLYSTAGCTGIYLRGN